MAARWPGKEKALNAGNSEFMVNSALNELDLSKAVLDGVMINTQDCMDQSILSIFQDSAGATEAQDKSDIEEESESSLLTALTEILDSVEDDEGTLSPFDTLPDSHLLTNQKHRNCSPLRKLLGVAGAQTVQNPVSQSALKQEETMADGLVRSQLKSTHVVFTQPSDGHESSKSKGEGNTLPLGVKKASQKSLCSTNSLIHQRMETEIEVFTSTSLVNLVKLMHPYCLQLCLEEEATGWSSVSRQTASSKLNVDHTLPCLGEIWKYEKPSGDSDEEIDVDVTDDETKGELLGDESNGQKVKAEGTQLKSVLVNGNTSRNCSLKERKRVSFGSIQVVNFDEPPGEVADQNKLMNEAKRQTSEIALSVPTKSTKTPEDPTLTELESLTAPPSQTGGNNADITDAAFAVLSKGETKPKPLSLQQYRQLRQKRQPLVENQGNNTTKWPCLSEVPKELSPILCLQGPKTTHHNAITLSDSNCSRSKTTSQQTLSSRGTLPPGPHSVEAKPSNPARQSRLKRSRTESKTISPVPVVAVPQSRTSPAKKPMMLNSDPPNPVLLPQPVAKTDRIKPASLLAATKCFPETKPREVHHDGNTNLKTTNLLQEIPKRQVQREAPSQEPKSELLLLNHDPDSENLQATKSEVSKRPSNNKLPLSQSQPQYPTTTQTELIEKQPSQESIQNSTTKTEPFPKIPQSLNPDLTQHSSQHPTWQTDPVNIPTPLENEPTGTPLCFPSSEELQASSQIDFSESTPMGDSGIEASDLTSLLEQFEETQAKVETKCELQATPENIPGGCVSPNFQTHLSLGRAQEIQGQGSFSTSEMLGRAKDLTILQPHRTVVSKGVPEPLGTEIILSTQDRTQAKQQRTLSPLSPQRKQPAKLRLPSPRAIQIIDPQPLPFKKTQPSLSKPLVTPAYSRVASCTSVFSDHDYCIPQDPSVSATTCRNPQTSTHMDDSYLTNKTQPTTHNASVTTICKSHDAPCAANATSRLSDQRTCSETKLPTDPDGSLPGQEYCSSNGKVEDTPPLCILATPPPSPPDRGREKTVTRRYQRSHHSRSSSASSSSSSCSSSPSPSPKRQRFRPERSESSSSSSSGSCSRSVSCSPPRRYRFSYSRSRSSRSRSRSWSQSRSRSRSPSPQSRQRRWRDVYSKETRRRRRQQEIRIQKLKAIDERRVVYVGRIRRSMKHDELRERFSLFGEVECVSLHFRDKIDSYGFVTFYDMKDAFAAIENGSKLRRPDELPFDICFGGRRQFCKTHYADLDSSRDVDSSPAHNKFEDLDFDSLLKQAQKGIKM